MHRPFRIDRITPSARFLSTRGSADLHFSNEYYLAGLFKRKVGHFPGRYRRMVEAGKVIWFDIEEVEPGNYVNLKFCQPDAEEQSPE